MKDDVAKGLRYGSTVLYVFILFATLVLSGLAGPGTGPFSRPTADVSNEYNLCITPAGYTFAIWALIYIMLSVIAVYSIVLLIRKVNSVPSYQNGGAVSVPFLALLSLNLCFNIGWLFAWDDEKLTGAAAIVVIMVATNVAALCFSAVSFKKTSAELKQVSKADFWMSTIVINGQLTYTTWTIIAFFVNLGIAIKYGNDSSNENRPDDDVICIAILSTILVAFMIYFIIEHTLLKVVARPLYLHYFVYLWAMIGSYVKNKEESPVIANLIISNIFFAALFIVLRTVFLIVYKNKNRVVDK